MVTFTEVGCSEVHSSDELLAEAVEREASDVVVITFDTLHKASSNDFLDTITASLIP